jgi:hypothetical protein
LGYRKSRKNKTGQAIPVVVIGFCGICDIPFKEETVAKELQSAYYRKRSSTSSGTGEVKKIRTIICLSPFLFYNKVPLVYLGALVPWWLFSWQARKKQSKSKK